LKPILIQSIAIRHMIIVAYFLMSIPHTVYNTKLNRNNDAQTPNKLQ